MAKSPAEFEAPIQDAEHALDRPTTKAEIDALEGPTLVLLSRPLGKDLLVTLELLGELVGATGNNPPEASFTSIVTGLNVSVTSTATDAEGPIETIVWNWGDGSAIGSGANASHNYTSGGTYTIRQTVIDTDGNSSSTTATITAVDLGTPPTAGFVTDIDGLDVDVESTATDPDGPIVSIMWDWGDNTSDSSGTSAVHTYAAAGTYTITQTVTDAQGDSAATQANVTVTDPGTPPTAGFTTDIDELQVDVTSTATDADGPIVSIVWDWGDNTSDGTGSTASHTYASPGTYTITQTVTDAQGDTDQTTVDVIVTDAVAIIAPNGNAIIAPNGNAIIGP